MTHERNELGELAGDYHRPPETPREEMWAVIRQRIAADSAREAGGDGATVVPIGRARRSRPGRLAAWLGAGAAAAAVLVAGFALGRFTSPATVPAGTVAAGLEAAGAAPVFRTAAATHLSRSEELLTLVRTDARAGRVDQDVGAWGRDLLLETRLLLDSPAADDPELRSLLEDLEMILAQVSVLAQPGVVGARGRAELRLIADGLEHQDMLPRIQAVIPAMAGS